MEESKKLKLDANGNIELDDGSEARDEMNKEAEKSLKDVQKELDTRSDLIDDINDAKIDDFVMRDGAGKKLNIKRLKEKLCLSEDEIEEAIPRDVARSYKKSNYVPASNVDLQAAEYKELTPEEAYKQIKAGNAKDIRLLFSDEYDSGRPSQLITLKDTGYGSTDSRFRNKYVSYDKAYTKKNGDVIRDTAHMPVMHVLNIADKIYLTNETSTFKDANKLASRAENPESPRYRGVGRSRDGRASVMPPRKPGAYYGRSYYANDIKSAEHELKDLKNRLSKGEISQDDYDRQRERYLRYLSGGRLSLANYRDQAARLRNLQSEESLQKNIIKFGRLKSEVDSAKNRLSSYKDKLDSVKASGSPETRRMKDEYQELLRKLNKLQRSIALYELKLEDTDDTDNEALKQAQSIYDAQEATYNSLLSEINKLLRRN